MTTMLGKFTSVLLVAGMLTACGEAPDEDTSASATSPAADAGDISDRLVVAA